MKDESRLEIDEMLNDAADSWVNFSELLRENHCTFDEALYQVDAFRQHFSTALEQLEICQRNPLTICYGICEKMKEAQTPSDMLRFLYCAVVTDRGLLLDLGAYERDDEQDIRCWFEQKKRMGELSEYLQMLPKHRMRLKSLLQEKIQDMKQDVQEEQALLYQLSLEHGFLYSGRKSKVYLENICELVRMVNCNSELKSVKPYVYMAALSRKHKMMLERSGFCVNWKNLFQPMQYHIDVDNGKNFNTYQSYLELYDHLRRNFIADNTVDIAFSDFCFAACSNLSKWYEENCEPNEEIPMNPRQKAASVMSDFFPNLVNYREFLDFDLCDFIDKNPVLEIAYENTFAQSENLFTDTFSAIYTDTEIAPLVRQLYLESDTEKICSDAKSAYQYARLFLIGKVQESIRSQILDTVKYF